MNPSTGLRANPASFEIEVVFWSYFNELTGTSHARISVSDGTTLQELLHLLILRFPKLGPMRKSILIAVGVEYQPRSYALQPGDEVSCFPPVQGG